MSLLSQCPLLDPNAGLNEENMDKDDKESSSELFKTANHPNLIRVGYWWSQKKTKKFNVAEFAAHCKRRGLELIKLDLESSLELQGPLAAIVHKLSDVLVKADQGDLDASKACQAFEGFVSRHPQMVVIDPLENVRKLLDRYRQYKLVEDSELAIADEVFTPAFVELTTNDVKENLRKLNSANVPFPVVCKPSLAHGSTLAHQMTLVFGAAGLKDIVPPCVAQTFICHGAILYKLFIIGDRYYMTERPSLKNFKAEPDRESIFFDSHDISKPNSASSLIKLDEADSLTVTPRPLKATLDRIVNVLQRQLGLDLFGIDVIVESATGRYAIIDMNTFPGYDGVDNLWEAMCDLILERIVGSESSSLRPLSSSSAASIDDDRRCSLSSSSLSSGSALSLPNGDGYSASSTLYAPQSNNGQPDAGSTEAVLHPSLSSSGRRCLCCPISTECDSSAFKSKQDSTLRQNNINNRKMSNSSEITGKIANTNTDTSNFDPSTTEDSGIDTSDSCDEKKKLTNFAAGKNVRRQHSRNVATATASSSSTASNNASSTSSILTGKVVVSC